MSRIQVSPTVLRVDTSKFEAAMQAAAEAIGSISRSEFAAAVARAAACRAHEQHLFRHHMPEDPTTSAMHAAYDRRRRARRRR